MITQENATFGDALDRYEKWCEQRHTQTKDRMSAGSIGENSVTRSASTSPRSRAYAPEDISSPFVQNYVYKKSLNYRALHFELYQQIRLTLQRAVWEELISISPLDVKKVRMPATAAEHENDSDHRGGARPIPRARARRPDECAHPSSHCNITPNDDGRALDVRRHDRGEMAAFNGSNVDFVEALDLRWHHSLSRF